MASGAIDQIDSLYDIPALTAQQKQVEEFVKRTIDQIKAARSESIGLNVNTKTFDDYNKKIKEMELRLGSLQRSSDDATKSSILLAKQKEAEAKAHLANTRATTAETKEVERQGTAITKNAKAAEQAARPYRQQEAAFKAASQKAQDLAIQYGILDSRTQSAVKEALELNNSLKVTDALIGNHQRNVGNYSGTLNKYINTLRGLQGPSRAISHMFGLGADTVNQFRLAVEHALQALQSFGPKSNPITAVGSSTKDLLATAGAQTTLAKATNATTTSQVAFSVATEESAVASEALTEATVTTSKGMKILKIALASIGIGLILAGIAYLVVKFMEFRDAAKEAGHQQELLNKITEESASSIAKESTSLKILRASIESTEVPMETRLQGIKDLREMYPDYFENLTNEQILTGNVADAYDLAAAAIIRKARASAAASQIEINAAKELKLTQEDLADVEETNKKLREKQGNSTVDEFGNLIDVTKQTNTLLKDAFKNRQDLRTKELAAIKKDNDFLLKIAVAGAKETIKIDDLKKKKKEPKGKDIAEANRKAEFEILKANLELAKEFDLRRAADEKKSFVERVSNLINYSADSQRLIEAQAAFELGAAELTAKEREKIENDKANALIRLSTELGEKLSKLTADNFKVDTKAMADSVKGMTGSIAKAIADYQAKLKKMQEDAQKAAEELAKQTKNAVIGLASELEGLFFDIFTNAIDRQKNAIQDQIDLLEQQKQKEIEVVNASITNAAEKADAIAIIEARSQAKKAALELKQRQLDQQKARFEKARGIAEIIQSTALAVVNALTQVKTLGPGAIALAALIGAIGAVQIARALAQPIPKYKEGTENHPGGLAVVGDGGKSEGIQLPDGSIYKTPASATVVDMPQGSKVYKDYSNMRVAASGELIVADTSAELRHGFNQVVVAIKRIPQPIIHAERAWTRAHKTGSTFRNYLNQRL